MADERDEKSPDNDVHAVYNRGLDLHESRQITDVPIIRELLQIPVTNSEPYRRKQLGFLCKSVAITNPTGQWFYSGSLVAFIPPWCINLIFNVPGGTQMLDFLADTPVGETSNGLTGQNMLVVACSVEQQPTSAALYIRTAP